MSLTISGWVSGVLLAFFKYFEVDVGSDAMAGFITVMLGFYALIGVYVGRYRHGDITWYGRKKKKPANA